MTNIEQYGGGLANAVVEAWPRLTATDLDWMATSVADVGAEENNPAAAWAAEEIFFLAAMRRFHDPVCWAVDLVDFQEVA